MIRRSRNRTQLSAPTLDADYVLRRLDASLGWVDLAAEETGEIHWRTALPVRGTPAYRDQWHLSGRYFCATTQTLLRVESLLEWANLMLLDFDAEVDWIVSQPFRVYSRRGERMNHVPDFLATREAAPALVVDVMRAKESAEPDRVAKSVMTRTFCDRAGWDYCVAVEPDENVLANVDLLRRCARPPADLDDYRPLLLTACRRPRTFRELRALGRSPIAIVPSLYHLLWQHELEVDIASRWTLTTEVWRP